MADEFVRIGQFEQFCRGNDQRFLDLEKKMDQGFAHASKEREHILVHLDQRFENVNQRFDSLEKRFDDLRKIVMIMLTALVSATVVAVVGAAVKYIFFSG